MRFYERALRLGVAALVCTVGIRLMSMDAVGRAIDNMIGPRTTAFLIYLHTGRNLRPVLDRLEYQVDFTESPAPAALPAGKPEIPEPTETVPPEKPTLPGNAADAGAISVSYFCDRRPDLQQLLDQPVTFTDTAGAPAVLILSTHSTESYRYTGEPYQESSDYRTLDRAYNMISIGSCVARLLEAQGIPVVQDAEFHDYPSYNGSYTHARKAIEAYLKENPSIQMVLDLHRDAAEVGSGQLRTRATVDGKDSAQLMLVMGSDSSGLQHAHWQQNLSLALKLQLQLEALAPGITRPISLRAQRFNQDLCPGALLVEVGAAGNTHGEALAAAEILAKAIGQVMGG